MPSETEARPTGSPPTPTIPVGPSGLPPGVTRIDNPLDPPPPITAAFPHPTGTATVLGQLADVINPARQGTTLDDSLARADSTRHFIAYILTFAVIAVSVVFALVTAWIMIKIGNQPTQDGKGGVYELDKVMPFATLVMGQTLYPLATIAIGWYFAARQAENKAGG